MKLGMNLGMNDTPFSPRTVGIVVAVAVVGFAAFLLLGAYAPDLRPGRDGGGHALSTSAIGFKGVVDMARATGAPVRLIRDEHLLGARELVVATPGGDVTPSGMRAFLAARHGWRTLIVLRKWQTQHLATNQAWVEQAGVLPEHEVVGPLQDVVPVELCRTGTSQSVCGHHVRPVLKRSDGGTFLAQVDNGPVWVLADPDTLDNHALASLAGAREAMQILRDAADPRAPGIAFDLTLNGFGRQPNLLKLAFEPPFLALTLCLLAAVALAVAHAAVRFGVPEREARALAFGKQALAENIAALLRLAKRSHRTGHAYATLVAENAGRASGSRLSGEALVRHLDRLGDGPRFSQLARAAGDARDEAALLSAARALHRWKENLL